MFRHIRVCPSCSLNASSAHAWVSPLRIGHLGNTGFLTYVDFQVLMHFTRQYQNTTFVNTTAGQKNLNFLPKLRFYSWQPSKGQTCSFVGEEVPGGRAGPADVARQSLLHGKVQARGEMCLVCSHREHKCPFLRAP